MRVLVDLAVENGFRRICCVSTSVRGGEHRVRRRGVPLQNPSYGVYLRIHEISYAAR